MVIFLSGGGSGEKSRKVDSEFISRINGDKPILYIPLARDPPYDSCMDWIISNFKPLKFSNFYMIDSPEKLKTVDLSAYSGVYIGGGNTYKLLKDLQSCCFLQTLKNYLARGGLFYGGSAGAIIIGADIGTADSENIYKLSDLKGLGFASGFSIYCHYTKDDDKKILDYYNSNHNNVLAIPKDAGIFIDRFKMQVIGPGSVTVFTNGSKHSLYQGSFIDQA
jgi:dipeptidase E